MDLDEVERIRMELWCRIAAECTRAENCRSKTVPAEWANTVLAAFDKRFDIKETHNGVV
jgi:hypothetical protein